MNGGNVVILKRDMTAAESNYLQCAVMITVAGALVMVVSTWDLFGILSIAFGIIFFIGFLYMKKKEDEKTIAEATKTVRKGQKKEDMKVRYTTRKERKAAEEKQKREKAKKSMPANNKKESIQKRKDSADSE